MARRITEAWMTPSYGQIEVKLKDLDKVLDDLVACFNERDLPRALLRAAGLELIRHLAPPHEVNTRLAQWQDRWREPVRMEQLPMRRLSVNAYGFRAVEGCGRPVGEDGLIVAMDKA